VIDRLQPDVGHDKIRQCFDPAVEYLFGKGGFSMAARLAIRGILAAAMLPVALGGGARAEDPGDPAVDRVRIVRATYAKLPPTILGVKEPIRVTQCALQTVPALYGLTFTDAEGTHHFFAWWLDRKKFQNQEYDLIDWVRYKGLSSVGGKKYRLPVRGPEEDALYGLLLRWAASQEAATGSTLFEQKMLDEVNDLLKRLDERFAGEKPVLQK